MVKGLYTAYTGMVNEQHRMDTLTNNLANAATTGYKKEGATSQSFDDVLGFKIKDTSEYNLPKKMGVLNMGVKIGESYVDYSQGPFRQTDNTFDLALSGDGFFAIEYTNKAGETSIKYSRDGSFTLTQDGFLVTKDGDFVLDNNNNHIHIDPLADVSIDRNGQIFANEVAGQTIQVTNFQNLQYLKKFGENLYDPVEGAVQIPGTAQIYSGYLEQANVSVVSEMVQMISVSRAYETNQKIVQAMDESLDVAVNNLGKLG